MPVVRSCDDDGVDVFPGKNLAVVARGEYVRAPEFLAMIEPSLIAIGDGNQLVTPGTCTAKRWRPLAS